MFSVVFGLLRRLPTQPLSASGTAGFRPKSGNENPLAGQTLRFYRRSLAAVLVFNPSGVNQDYPVWDRLCVIVLGAVRAVNPFVLIENAGQVGTAATVILRKYEGRPP
jgi:hypothetical protein